MPLKSNIYYTLSGCISSLSIPAHIAHALLLYCHLWPDQHYHIFPHYPLNGMFFTNKNYWTQNLCFDFLYSLCLAHFSF